MKKAALLLILALTVLPVGNAGAASSSVKGHTKKNGTYVSSHKRTKADSSKSNNWSTKGNTNPYTGKRGGVGPNSIKKR